MGTQFVARFHPSDVTNSDLLKIIANIYGYMNGQYPVDDYNRFFDFYDQLPMEVLSRTANYLVKERKFRGLSFIDLKIMNPQILDCLPHSITEPLISSIKQLWKTPNIRDYHTFLQLMVVEYKSIIDMYEMVEESIYQLWREIDHEEFFSFLLKYSKNDFLEEIYEIETFHIEKLI